MNRLGRQDMIAENNKDPFKIHGQKFKMGLSNTVDVF